MARRPPYGYNLVVETAEDNMANADTVAPADAIMHTPGVCGGDACIRQTRIPVWLLVQLRRMGADDPEIFDNYPSLTPADLSAAWDYQRQHPAEIEAAIADQERDD